MLTDYLCSQRQETMLLDIYIRNAPYSVFNLPMYLHPTCSIFDLYGRWEQLPNEISIDQELAIKIIHKLIQRHSILHTKVVSKGKRIHSNVRYDVPVKIENYSTNDRIQLNNTVRSWYNCDFDIEQPEHRIYFVQYLNREVIVWIYHHLFLDEFSIAILSKEFQELYHRREITDSLQYLDFCMWEQEYALSVQYKADEDWWKLYLDNIPSNYELDLPYTFVPNRITNYTKRLRWQITSEDHQRLNTFIKHHRLTYYMFYHLCLSLVLRELCGQQRILLPAMAYNRDQPHFDSIVGMTTNMNLYYYNYTPIKTIEDATDNIRSIHHDILKRTNINLSIRKSWIKGIVSQSVDSISEPSYMKYTITDAYAPYDMLWLNQISNNSKEYNIYYRPDIYSIENIMTMYNQWNSILISLISCSGLEISNFSFVSNKKMKLYHKLKDYMYRLKEKRHLIDMISFNYDNTSLNNPDLSLIEEE